MIEDQLDVADLVNRWAFYRDQQRWAQLRDTFVAGGSISISWFHGPHEDFVRASEEMAERGGSVLKHQLGVPAVTVNGDRALSEVNVIIMVRARTRAGEVDTSSYARFLDRLVRQDGRWRFAERVGIYEKDRIDPVDTPALPASLYAGPDDHPAEIRFLGRSLKAAGLPISETIVLDRSPALAELYERAQRWLHGAEHR